METPSPGQVVSPQSGPESAAPAPETPPEPAPQPEQSPQTPEQSTPPADAPPEPQTDPDVSDAISWTASEYIAHHKSGGWYLLLVIAGALAAAGAYFLTGGDIVSVTVIVLVVIVFGAYGARKPRQQQYAISHDGITIGPKTYSFHQFKSFSIIDEDAFSSITFMPLQRFMPAISIYYDPQDEDRIVEVLSAYLPFEDRGHDPIERFMRKIRF